VRSAAQKYYKRAGGLGRSFIMYTKTERKLFTDKELAEREKLIEAIITACDEDDLRVFTTDYLKSLYDMLYPEVD